MKLIALLREQLQNYFINFLNGFVIQKNILNIMNNKSFYRKVMQRGQF